MRILVACKRGNIAERNRHGHRSANRSKGIKLAQAMADQWGGEQLRSTTQKELFSEAFA